MAFLRTLALAQARHLPHNPATFIRRLSSSSRPPPSKPLRTGLYATLFALSTGLFAVYYFDSRSAIHRYVFTPLIRYALDPETGHKLAVKILRTGLSPRDTQPDDQVLRAQLWDQILDNPVGLAAGFDKNADAIDGLFNLGFSWVEIGSVTPRPQPGNPKPRVFHLVSDGALINRYGFPSDGHAAVQNRSLLAINLGKNKTSPQDSISDFLSGVHAFAPYADVLVINVSSPNTPGLRNLQSHDTLKELLAGVSKARDEVATSSAQRPKIVLKVAPDLSESDLIDMAATIRTADIDGVIVSNTTISRPAHLRDASSNETGGLSGVPLKPLSLLALRTLRAHLPPNIPLVGCGGITSGSDALEFAKAGASFVQVYTGFGYDGVGMCRRVKDELAAELRKEGTTWNEVVKKSVEQQSWKEPPPVKVEDKLGEDVSVRTLIEEAEELKRLVDQLGARMAQHP